MSHDVQAKAASHILKRHLQKKKKDFPNCSYRWLASKLGISPAGVSQILNGKRDPRPRVLRDLCHLLDIDEDTTNLLYSEALSRQGWEDDETKGLQRLRLPQPLLDEEWEGKSFKDFSLLEDWFSIAVLEATLLKDYDGTPGFLSKRLNAPEAVCQEIFQKLKSGGYLKETDGKWRKAGFYWDFQSKKNKSFFRSYHRETLKRADKALNDETEEAIEQRLITSATVTCARDHVPTLRAELTKLFKIFAVECAKTSPEEVYQIGIQFFPLTK